MPPRPRRLLLALCAWLAAGSAGLAGLGPSEVVAQDEEGEWLAIPSGGLNVRPVPGLSLGGMEVILSPDRVETRYLLANASEQRRLLDVGFPIPSPQRAPGDGPPIASAFSDARVTLDGELMALSEVRIRVFMRGVDVTEILLGAGIDLKALASGSLADQPRERRRAMQKALIDNGIAVDPIGWSLAVEPAWAVPLPARSTAWLSLSYSPYAGRSLDRLPGDEGLDNLAHLAAYCAEDDEALLAWVQQQVALRAAAREAELLAAGQGEERAAANAFADIVLRDLSFLWLNGPWPRTYAEVVLIVDPGDGRAAFCAPARPSEGDDREPERPAVVFEGGVYRVELTNLPADTRLDIMFLQ